MPVGLVRREGTREGGYEKQPPSYFQLPEAITRVDIPVGVGYRSDPAHVEGVLLDEANKAVGKIPGLFRQPEPGCPLHRLR